MVFQNLFVYLQALRLIVIIDSLLQQRYYGLKEKETLSSFRDSDKTAKTLSETPVEQKSRRSYLHIKVRTFCYIVLGVEAWRYIKLQKQKE